MNKNMSMYKEMQLSADINVSSKKELLLMMYDAVIVNLNDAIVAIQNKDIFVKIKKIEKVLSIIELGLIMSLSKTGAKEVAESLELFYEDASNRIVLANIDNNTKALFSIKSSFIDLRKCWEVVND